jgi:hypothetical protein
MTGLSVLRTLIASAQESLGIMLERAIAGKGITIEAYRRYLSMEYHLTKGVQRYFITAAAHEEFFRHKKLRQFLLDFANEEERHYLVAANDLHKCGLTLTSEPFDVTLWHAYFRGVVTEKPLIRLGAACILESISGGAAREPARRALSAPFLTRDNSKFLVMHQHEMVPHGDMFLAALESVELDKRQLGDLETGARHGTILYLRMAEWCLFPDEHPGCSDMQIDDRERLRIETLEMTEIAPSSMSLQN